MDISLTPTDGNGKILAENEKVKNMTKKSCISSKNVVWYRQNLAICHSIINFLKTKNYERFKKNELCGG